MTTHVYGVYAEDGSLIYIGCTKKLKPRMSVHRTVGKFGSTKVTPKILETFNNRSDALEKEAALILFHKPKLNVLHAHSREQIPSTTVRIPVAMHANVRIMAAQKGTRIATEVQDAISIQLAAHRKLCRDGKRMPNGKAKQ